VTVCDRRSAVPPIATCALLAMDEAAATWPEGRSFNLSQFSM
jgi:hypothetical protein